MSALLAGLLLLLPAAAPDGAAAFERLKKLEGNWRAKEGQTVSLRVIGAGQAVLETDAVNADKGLASVGVYRLEGSDLVLSQDGEGHAVLKFLLTTPDTLRFEAPGRAGVVAVTFTLRDADTLRRTVVTRAAGKDTAHSVDYTREYLDTLK